ncbi:MAG TPA: hypothetical protein VMD77_03805 [Candidatus Baltobacteraceae bacterium]|nr:hypothetical protein [Candidatus Baltobacteraceae bacterium]
MRFCRSNERLLRVSMRNTLAKTCCHTGALLGAVLLAAFLPSAFARAQSSAQSAAPSQSSESHSSAQSSASSSATAEPTMQVAAGDKPQSLADAARQNAHNAKPKPKHVYTDDDISNVGGTISVVGDSSSSRGDANSSADAQGSDAASSDSKDEKYWRERADAIKNQIADVDRQIEDKKAEIAKAGPASFDPSAGLSQGVIVIHDRNAELKDLEDRKQSLQDQLDELADEGRKAGADSGWFR